jgi:hypothetical protein
MFPNVFSKVSELLNERFVLNALLPATLLGLGVIVMWETTGEGLTVGAKRLADLDGTTKAVVSALAFAAVFLVATVLASQSARLLGWMAGEGGPFHWNYLSNAGTELWKARQAALLPERVSFAIPREDDVGPTALGTLTWANVYYARVTYGIGLAAVWPRLRSGAVCAGPCCGVHHRVSPLPRGHARRPAVEPARPHGVRPAPVRAARRPERAATANFGRGARRLEPRQRGPNRPGPAGPRIHGQAGGRVSDVTCARDKVRRRLLTVGAMLAALPAAVVGGWDALDQVTCQVPKTEIAKGATIERTNFEKKVNASRADAGRDPVSVDELTSDRRAAAVLPVGTCVRTNMLTGPFAQFPLTASAVIGSPTVGAKVDLLFAPTGSQDNRDGASVEGVRVISYANPKLVVEVTAAQQATILKHVARSQLTVHGPPTSTK